MSIQTLTPPLDITWTRLAFTRDMIVTNFGDLAFGPKWRSSLAVYYFIVPEEETADGYPNSRIVYLKFTCSITGWNPSEELLGAKKTGEDSGAWDDLQRSLWEVIVASGWASTYWPCLGAIMQIAVYPNNPNGIAPDDYPYIMDFEPKKRELFEQVTEGGEFLSGSSDKLSTTKGSTNTQSVDVKAGGSFLGIGLSASAGATWQQVDSQTTDTSRENRETLSHTTSFSQMYQLFNGYHLGTNRALFVVAPRPHTVSTSDQTDFNLINGERKLEGIQDVFLVIHMPKSLDGFCIQAGLDTGHEATVSAPQHLVMLKHKSNEPDGGNDPQLPPPPPPPPTTPIKQLVITRRLVQSCGTFDENGNFHLRQLPEPHPKPIVGEIGLPELPARAMLRSAPTRSRPLRVEVADNMNMMQSQINRLMLDSASSAAYTAKNFEETDVFKSLVATAVQSSTIPLAQLANKGYLNRQTARLLTRNKIITLGNLFSNTLSGTGFFEFQSVRMEMIAKLLEAKAK
jgi:hypothetical protein